MCGIFGAFGKNVQSERLTICSKTISHRGPDNFGTVQKENLYLSHHRLAILELSDKANQPFKDDRFILLYNGELYNHKMIRERFSLSECKTNSDTETLFYLLKNHGVQALQYLTGMFAGVWVNLESNSAFLFRDTLGVKPLYYFFNDETFYFSSETKAFQALDVKLKVNRPVAATYFKFENYPEHVTLIEGVVPVKKGEILEVSIKNPKIENATRYSYKPLQEKSFDRDILGNIRTLVESSVEQHLLSDVDVGVYMSGGVDSTLVASLAKRTNPNIFSYTGYFDVREQMYDERNLAREAAKKNNIEFHEVKITAQDFISHFEKLIYHLDQPRMGMGSFSQYVVALEVAKKLKVILAGHGGDEIFAGYPIHKIAYFSKYGFLKNVSALNLKDVPWLIDFELFKFKTKKVKYAPMIYADMGSLLDSEFLFNENNSENINEYYKNLYIYGLLEVEDKISMAHSLETRVPLWSQDIVHYFYNIELVKKMPGGKLKGALKEAFADVLPESVINGPKRGFPTPLRLWFRTDLFDYVYAKLNDKSNSVYSIVDYDKVMSTLLEHKKRPLPFVLDERRAHKIWIALSMAEWFRQSGVEA